MTTKTKKRPVEARTDTPEATAQPERALNSDEREEALDAAHTEMERLAAEQVALQAGIDQAQAEIAHLQIRIDDRHKAIGQIAARVAAALQATEAQESYISLFAGKAGTRELERLKSELEKIESEHTRSAAESATLNDQDTASVAQLWALIAQDRATIDDLQRKKETLAAARQKLLTEHGASLFLECSALLTDIEQRNRECRDAMHLADSAMQDARAAVIRRLSPWPEVRRRLEAEYKVSSDGSVETMEAFLHLSDALLTHGRQIDILLVSELELTKLSLQALTMNNCQPMAEKRERVASLLANYRKQHFQG